MNGLDGSFKINGGLSLRLCRQSDEAFLFELFIQARPWLAWAEGKPDFIRDLYEQQYSVMRKGQESIYPEHLDLLIERMGQSVGRIVIDLGYADWRISEIEIISSARGTGIGSHVIKGLQIAAKRGMRPLTISTPAFGPNDQRSLYQALGFRIKSDIPPLVHMIWHP